MTIKVVFSMLVLLLLLGISYVYAYHTRTETHRSILTFAEAAASNGGLRNGTYNAYAYVSSGDIDAGSFSSESVFVFVLDSGSTLLAATANAYIGGYNSSGQYRYSSSSSYLPGN